MDYNCDLDENTESTKQSVKKPWTDHQEKFMKFRKMILQCAPLVVTDAPQVQINGYCKVSNAKKDFGTYMATTKENIDLIMKLNALQRTHGYVEHILPKYKPNNSRIKTQCRINNAIEAKNKIIEHSLRVVRPELEKTKTLDKLWQIRKISFKHCAKYPLILPGLSKYNDYAIATKHNRPLVYLDVGKKNASPLGRIVIMLYIDYCPRTVENFIDMCENHRDWPHNKHICVSNRLCLKGTVFHRVFPGLYFEGGDIVKLDQERLCDPESLELDHNCRGTLSMTPIRDGLVGTQFAISFKPIHTLNGKRCAFGKIVKGAQILDVIQCYGTKDGKPKIYVEITNCGILKL